MNKALFAVLFSVIAYTASSQRIYFIYLQTETQQPFFVKLDEKIHSSSASGYLILSRLKDSTYEFTVGFTGNLAGEQKFSCAIAKRDHGYLLKNFGEKGWGLLDLQTSSVQMAKPAVKKETSSLNNPVNAFTELLARAADDSTLKHQLVLPEEKKPEPVAQAAAKKEDPGETAAGKADNKNTGGNSTRTGTTALVPAATVIKQQEDNRVSVSNPAGQKKPAGDKITLSPSQQPLPDSSSASKQTGTPVVVAEEKAGNAPVSGNPAETYVRSQVVRKSESSTTEGFGLLYIDNYADGTRDTIRLVIPNEQGVQFADAVTKDAATTKTAAEAGVTDTSQHVRNISQLATKSPAKNTCHAIASDADFYRLRKRMAGGKSDGAMLDEAKRTFKTKCFTTGQVRNLGSLFLGDGGKYNFFDAAYNHVSDQENFASLQAELKDDYFINRFKTILQ